MSARSARILLAVMLLAPAADAGWFGGDAYKKKLPKPIKMDDIRPHDANRLKRPSKIFPRIDDRLGDPNWGGQGSGFYRGQHLRVKHQHQY
jgi:hypothetical protein